MSDHTPPLQPGSAGPTHGGPPVPPAPPAQSYPGFPSQPAPAQPAPAHPAQSTYPAPAPQGPYGYAPGHVAQSPYAPQGQPYPSPPYAVPARPTNGLALTALICGIAGIVLSPTILFLVVPIVISIAAVVFGHIAMARLKRDPGAGGRGMALTGLILGYVPIVVSLLGLIILVIITVSIGAFTLPFVFAS